jgi:hypothetical protein
MRSLTLALLLAIPLAAQESKYEQILVPFDTMVLETAAATWRSDLWVRNDGSASINLLPEECFAFGLPVPCNARLDVAAGRTQRLDAFPLENAEFPGVLLYVPRGRSRDVTFNLRIRDQNRGLDDIGTDIPVVREGEMRTGKTSLINIPIQPNGRIDLRIYSAVPVTAEYVVRMYAEPTGDLLSERTYSRVMPTDPPSPARVPVTVNASSIFRGWVIDRVRVEVEPKSAWPYYPLLTITNNRNNQLTVVTPQ